ncbi:MAG: iron ABC transporter permease [Euryarchaeota archaeon]|nr:iron ABC transporter permease [Euryarchaeota archaeon]
MATSLPQKSAALDDTPVLSGIEKYEKYTSKKTVFLIISAIGLLVLALVSVSVGSVSIPFEEVIHTLFGSGEEYRTIIWNIRLPRVITGIIAGAALAIAGTVMQCVLHNPLASPYTLGLSQAAAFGASFAIVMFGAGTMQSSSSAAVIVNNPYIVTISAFAWALLGTGIIVVLSVLTRVSPEAMILAGVAIGSIFSAGITAVQYFADHVQLASMVYWTFGDLGRSNWNQVWILLAVALPTIVFFMINRWNYNAIEAGEETAKSLGVNVSGARIGGMILSSLLAAVVVSFMGIIGFVGLLAPHMIRRLIGGNHRYLIPGSAIWGAAILMGSDTLARTVVSPLILPVGIITSFMGGPLFIYLLIRGYRK